MGTWPALHYPG